MKNKIVNIVLKFRNKLMKFFLKCDVVFDFLNMSAKKFQNFFVRRGFLWSSS